MAGGGGGGGGARMKGKRNTQAKKTRPFCERKEGGRTESKHHSARTSSLHAINRNRRLTDQSTDRPTDRKTHWPHNLALDPLMVHAIRSGLPEEAKHLPDASTDRTIDRQTNGREMKQTITCTKLRLYTGNERTSKWGSQRTNDSSNERTNERSNELTNK